MARKPHPADEADLVKIATATHFNVHLRNGPFEKTDRQANSLAEAVRIADELGETPNGRRALIYAVTADNRAVLVPASLIAQAKQEAATAAASSAEKHRAGQRRGRRAELAEAASKGILPPPPDFSAATHARFRQKLAALVALVKAGDVEGLKAVHLNPVSTSPKALARYRDLAVIALEAINRGAK